MTKKDFTGEVISADGGQGLQPLKSTFRLKPLCYHSAGAREALTAQLNRGNMSVQIAQSHCLFSD
ncbi:MAG TPA: hypothetical protein VGB17_06165 [Pyrinomonadaceae bacterium]|jgi:hypothetical protein